MRAIHTKYLPATNRRSARIKAYLSDGRSITRALDYSLGDVDRHAAVAREFIAREFTYVSADAPLVFGDSADGRGYVFCFAESRVE